MNNSQTVSQPHIAPADDNQTLEVWRTRQSFLIKYKDDVITKLMFHFLLTWRLGSVGSLA